MMTLNKCIFLMKCYYLTDFFFFFKLKNRVLYNYGRNRAHNNTRHQLQSSGAKMLQIKVNMAATTTEFRGCQRQCYTKRQVSCSFS